MSYIWESYWQNINRDCQFLEMYIFKVLFVFNGLNLKVLFTDLCVRWNLHSEIGLNEKKIKFSYDIKITVQVFNTLSSKFPQIITNLTEDTELAFTERYIWLSSCLLSFCHISWTNQIQTLLLSFLLNVLSHFPNFIFPSEVLHHAINYLLKVEFSNMGFAQAMQWFLFFR